MKVDNKNIAKWRDIVLSASSALETRDFSLYEELMNEANRIVDKIKRDDELTYECKNFGISNYIFEDALPELFKSNKDAVREFTNALKEDKNLLTQYHFVKAMENYNNVSESKTYIEELLSIAEGKLDRKTLTESNKKLSDIIKKYSIRPSEKISEDKLAFFESCNYLLSNKKKMTNLSEINRNIETVKEYIEKNPKTFYRDKMVEYQDVLGEFDRKYSSIMTEEEKEFIKKMLFGDKEEKENAFNDIKEDCLRMVDASLSKTDDEDEKQSFNAIKEQLSSMQFNERTYYNNVKKILKISEVLDD